MRAMALPMPNAGYSAAENRGRYNIDTYVICIFSLHMIVDLRTENQFVFPTGSVRMTFWMFLLQGSGAADAHLCLRLILL